MLVCYALYSSGCVYKKKFLKEEGGAQAAFLRKAKSGLMSRKNQFFFNLICVIRAQNAVLLLAFVQSEVVNHNGISEYEINKQLCGHLPSHHSKLNSAPVTLLGVHPIRSLKKNNNTHTHKVINISSISTSRPVSRSSVAGSLTLSAANMASLSLNSGNT